MFKTNVEQKPISGAAEGSNFVTPITDEHLENGVYESCKPMS